MRQSKYVYFINDEDNTIIFNGVNERFIIVNSSNADYYKNIMANPSSYYDNSHVFFDKMLADGFFVKDGNEETLINEKFNKLRKDDEYHIMVLPTYQCNLRCWYCVQEHQNLFMSNELVGRVKKHISEMLKKNDINTLLLSWFGGEPLLAYDTIVDVTRFAQQAAQQAGKNFRSSITTNATLLTPKRIEELHDLGIDNYQITIDGKKDVHDNIRHLAGVSTFERIMKNVNLIAQHTSCCLRFNYTDKNLEPEAIVSDIRKNISEKSKKNINFLIYKVWQEDGNKIAPERVKDLFERSNDIGIHPRLSRSGMCYADQKYFNCIMPNGTVEKCDNNNPEKAVGRLDKNGKIVWKDGEPSSHTPTYLVRDSECVACQYLPICWGPCVQKRTKMLEKYGRIRCIHSNKEEYMATVIKNIVKNSLGFHH